MSGFTLRGEIWWEAKVSGKISFYVNLGMLWNPSLYAVVWLVFSLLEGIY